MATDLGIMANEALRKYRANLTKRLFELTVGNDVPTLDAVTELTEEYTAYVTALEGAQDREDANYGAFTAFVDAFGVDVDDAVEIEKACNSFDNAYVGTMAIEQYAQELTEDCCDIPVHLKTYIDYDAMGRDMLLGGDITENDGHLFNSNW